MASSFRPPNLSGDDVQETLEKEKGEADGIVVVVHERPRIADPPLDIELVGERSDSSSEIDTPPSNDCPRLPSTDLDNHVTNVSGGGSYQLRTPMPTATGANQSTLDDVEASSSEESIYQSVRSDTPTNPVKIYGMGTDDLPADPFDSQDLARSIPGLYRILELVTEQGSGGLAWGTALTPSQVDKIIISQNSLKEFINTISPGAYASMTKVNFNMLDQCVVKPVGIYGSKEEIVRFLLTLRVADDTIATHLLSEPRVTEAHPTLRSGLYILRTTTDEPNGSEQIYVIHWPEQNTWDDSAPSQVRRNRVAFMRYLTRMCDQIVALVSPDHARRMVWNELGEDDEDDQGDRIIKCVVQRTTEQEESVQVREGFKGEPSECGEQCSMKPFLLLGETAQGFMTVQHQPSRRAVELFEGRFFSEIQLQNYLASNSLYLSEALDGRGLQILVHVGLEKRFSQECAEWKHQSKAIRERYKKIFDDRFRTARDELAKLAESLNRAARNAVIDAVVALYPFVDKQAPQYTGTCTEGPPVSFSQIIDAYPEADGLFQHNIQECSVISDPEFRIMKDQLCLVVELMPRTKHLDSKIRDPIWLAARDGGFQEAQRATKSLSPDSPGMLKMLSDFWQKLKKSFVNPQTDTPSIESILEEAQEAALKVTDSEFFRIVVEKKRVQKSPQLAQLAEKARLKAKSYLQRTMAHVVRKVVWSIREVQEKNCHARIKTECYDQEDQEQSKLRVQLIRFVNNLSTQVQSRHTLRINSVQQEQKHQLGPAKTYKLWGQQESQEDPVTCYTVHSMDVMEEDKHNSKLDPSSIPSPRFWLQSEFQLPLGHTILRAQLLEGQRLLLIVADRFGDISVYLETLAAMYGAIQQKRCKLLKRERIGRDIHLAFDESKRMLGIVSSDKLLLHVLEYDDSQRLKAKRSAISLNPWYGEGVFIHHACFICGSEEILLVDSQAQARVFSLAVMQLRPAVLNLPQVPTSVHCTADGSCILVIHSNESELAITAYHWNSFGSTEGIALNIPDLSVGEPLVVTSLIKRTAVHLLKLDLPTRCCQSYALDITRRHTELMFRERANRRPTPEKAHKTAHNCLIDCHSDVWTRFPVLAAVQRETISSASLRSRRTLVFVTDRDFDMFAPHFSQMIQSFERTIKKPTGNFLDSVKVSAAPFNVFAQELCDGTTWNVSQYRAGEWIVEFLCLIPIHIAVTKDNCFIPLKDGVYSPSLERELLGAGINRIVDSISFGWYESLFQSYMATKPVRVVSSMGEQSVGKSYALNHLVDTSFAGSAMRTTEGVWMSVTPTEKELIVALDFEGLFQSFQSSATVLDPTENPSLFQSTLVIIIKDAGEADKAEIGREFSLKFEKIVQDEQEANFITRLHAGRLNIIPWPVIESNEFYKLFTKVKQCLDQQPVTHPSAGEFLHKMKTLMAKLKANDWGAMSQTMASHRAQLLLSWLPNALIYGLQEIDPEPEPLKNVDTDIPIQFPDTQLQLFLTAGLYSQSDTREQTLTVLRNSWHQHEMRQHLPDPQWADSLSQYLERIVSMRIDHRRHASIEELRRTFDDATVDLRSNVQLCRLQCADCQLFCVVNAHLCGQPCTFAGKFGCLDQCTKVTDHLDEHICAALVHGCGEVNAFEAIRYPSLLNLEQSPSLAIYLGSSSSTDRHMHALEPVAYQGEAACAGRLHTVAYAFPAMLLMLVIVAKLASARLHVSYASDSVLITDHMHGLEEGAIHLCGWVVRSAVLTGSNHDTVRNIFVLSDCSVPGICEIETAPYSIEATFTGRHETFQYTKVTVITQLVCQGYNR
ncbi:hypothetical protein EDC04DRAFT_2604872 [Pisolithus marmoratus]|nr:hypothetical protein EDC04DRAFT_2604872 [Pisolithus marmoratus]